MLQQVYQKLIKDKRKTIDIQKLWISILIFRRSGFSTDGEIDKVLFVGPIAPATNR
jgi:hypothetical protein